MTAGPHSRQPPESQGGPHADGNKVALSSLYAPAKSKHIVRLALAFNYSPTIEVLLLMDKPMNVMNNGLDTYTRTSVCGYASNACKVSMEIGLIIFCLAQHMRIWRMWWCVSIVRLLVLLTPHITLAILESNSARNGILREKFSFAGCQ